MNINDWISVLNLDIEVLTAQIYNRLKQKGVMLFNDWEVPFLLLGVMMVVALQAGVFLAREEKDD